MDAIMRDDLERAAIKERLENDLNEVEGSEYVSVRRKDLKGILSWIENLTCEDSIIREDSKQLEEIVYMYRLKEKISPEALEKYMKEQTIVEDINNIKDLNEFGI